jgi:hypothetical protein
MNTRTLWSTRGKSRAHPNRMEHFRCCYRWLRVHHHRTSPPSPTPRWTGEEQREHQSPASPPCPIIAWQAMWKDIKIKGATERGRKGRLRERDERKQAAEAGAAARREATGEWGRWGRTAAAARREQEEGRMGRCGLLLGSLVGLTSGLGLFSFCFSF